MKVQARISEIAALSIVILLSIAANITDNFLGDVVSKKMLLVALTTIIVIALFRYLRLMLFITVAILAIGANLPEEIASSLGVSTYVMLASLGFLIFVSVVSYVFKLLPTGIEKPKIDSVESRKSVLTSVAKGDLVNLHRLLEMNVEINFFEKDTAPILIAAEKGYADVVQILVHHGANFRVQNAAGKTPMEIALANGFTRIAEIIHHVSENGIPQPV